MEEQRQTPNNQLNKWKVASIALELGFIIALPLVILGLLGKSLDGKFGSYPWITLAGILIAIGSTTVWMVRRFKELMK